MPPLSCNEDEARVLSETVLELLECQLLEEESGAHDTDEIGMAMVRFRMEYEEKNHDIGDEEGGSSISPKRRRCPRSFISINVFMYTQPTALVEVGKQLWSGSLLLADWILSKRDHRISNQTVLELGAGVGLPSIAAAMACHSTAILTDKDTPDIMSLLHRNIRANPDIEGRVSVRAIDWFCSPPWGWTSGELKTLQDLGGIFAADVVYDEEMASSFFETAKSVLLLSKKPHTTPLFLAMEKRFNFEAATLSVVATGYRVLLQATSEDCGEWRGEKIDLDTFPQVLPGYKRSKGMELWEMHLL
eukprot:105810_1